MPPVHSFTPTYKNLYSNNIASKTVWSSSTSEYLLLSLSPKASHSPSDMASKQLPYPLSLQDSATSHSDRRNNHTHHHPYLNQAPSFYFPSDPSSRATTPVPHDRPQSLELYPRSAIALPVSDEDAPSNSTTSAIQTWTPLALWVLTSIGFLLAITIWRTDLFRGRYKYTFRSHPSPSSFFFLNTFPFQLSMISLGI